MDVDDALRKCSNEVSGNSEQESGKDDVIDVMEQGYNSSFILCEYGAVHHFAGYAVASGTFKGLCFGAVANDQSHFDGGCGGKILDDVLQVGAFTAGENSKADGGSGHEEG